MTTVLVHRSRTGLPARVEPLRRELALVETPAQAAAVAKKAQQLVVLAKTIGLKGREQHPGWSAWGNEIAPLRAEPVA